MHKDTQIALKIICSLLIQAMDMHVQKLVFLS